MIVLLFVCVVLIGLAFAARVFVFAGHQAKQATDTEATALACVKELSRIVVNDPHFGFVALTEQAPGCRTVSTTGEPVRIRSINSILASIREVRILAKCAGNQQMLALTESEFNAAQETLSRLKDALNEAVDEKAPNRKLALDVNGKLVRIYETARDTYIAYSPQKNAAGLSIGIKLGVLAGGGPTITPAPSDCPQAIADVPASLRIGDKYASGVDVPCDGLKFAFVSVSPDASLANLSSFKECSGKQIGTVLRLTVSRSGDGVPTHIASACAIPPANEGPANYSALILGFPTGPVSEMNSVGDLLRMDLRSLEPPSYVTAENGDFPLDGNELVETRGPDDFRYALNRSVYDWLLSCGPGRSGTLKSIVDRFPASLVTPNEGGGKPCWVSLYFDKDAMLQVRSSLRSPCDQNIISEKQISGTDTMNCRRGVVRVSFTDDVYNIGATKSGKHGGQPIDIAALNRLSSPGANSGAETLSLASSIEFFDNEVFNPHDTVPTRLN